MSETATWVNASPHRSFGPPVTALQRRDASAPAPAAVPAPNDRSLQNGRIAYGAVALVSLAIMGFCTFQRMRAFRVDSFRNMNALRALVLGIYLVGICFVVADLILLVGVGITKLDRCKTAIYLCLVFYVGGKVLSYVFLCERMYALRANRHRRYQDPLYIVTMSIVILGFGTIAVFAFIVPVFEISGDDGRCRIGLPFRVTLPLLIYDVAMNLSMTALFVTLVWPYLRQHGWRSYLPVSLGHGWRRIRRLVNPRVPDPDGATSGADPGSRLERLIWKSLIGSVAILISTVVNLAILFRMDGHQLSWLCFTICTIDVTWTIVVIHLLTKSPEELDSEPRRATGSISPHSGFSIPGKDGKELQVHQRPVE